MAAVSIYHIYDTVRIFKNIQLKDMSVGILCMREYNFSPFQIDIDVRERT